MFGVTQGVAKESSSLDMTRANAVGLYSFAPLPSPSFVQLLHINV